MKFDKILRQMGAGAHPSDDEIEAAQRVQWELEQDKLAEQRNAEIAKSIKKCKTIADLLKYLYASVDSIPGSGQAYSGQELAIRVLRAVQRIRQDNPNPAEIRSIDEKFLTSILRMKPHGVTDGCGLATHLAQLIHNIELGDDFTEVARVIESKSGAQSRPAVPAEQEDVPVARTDKSAVHGEEPQQDDRVGKAEKPNVPECVQAFLNFIHQKQNGVLGIIPDDYYRIQSLFNDMLSDARNHKRFGISEASEIETARFFFEHNPGKDQFTAHAYGQLDSILGYLVDNAEVLAVDRSEILEHRRNLPKAFGWL